MTSRVIDMRLRKLEQKASQSALSYLTDAQLDAQIIDTLSVVAEPYGGDVRVMIEDTCVPAAIRSTTTSLDTSST